MRLKKRMLSNILLLGLIVIALVSCDDFLSTSPKTTINSDVVFDTPARILGQVNGMYKALKNADFYGEKELLLMDVRAEEFINVTANPITGYISWRNATTSGDIDVNNLWSAAYTTINNTNILIDGLTKTVGIISDSVKNNYIAEARFVRALSYFSLLTIYARPYSENQGKSKAIPLRLQAETSLANNNLACSTVADIYNQILADLDYAEVNLPLIYSTDLLNTTRAHRNTAIALKTRVFLNMCDYANLIAEAHKIVPQNNNPFISTTGVKHQLQDILTIFSSNYTTTESIFSLPMTAADSYSGQQAIGWVYNTNSEYYLNSSGILGDSQWGSQDVRRQFLRSSLGKYYLNKYAKTTLYTDFIPVIRYAEILLNYAEAAAQLGNLNLAQELLKAVHGRSDKNYVFANSDIATKEALVNTIQKERRIELLGEGFRSNDLLRTLQTIPAKGSSSMQVGAVSPSSQNYIYPFPNNEINTNNLLLKQ
ncbi:MAG: RagB/SusD family nutrient uptake outer membrane protein [Paludibacter sp.]